MAVAPATPVKKVHTTPNAELRSTRGRVMAFKEKHPKNVAEGLGKIRIAIENVEAVIKKITLPDLNRLVETVIKRIESLEKRIFNGK